MRYKPLIIKSKPGQTDLNEELIAQTINYSGHEKQTSSHGKLWSDEPES
jgi:hypothetical protein